MSLHWRDVLRTLANMDMEGTGCLAPNTLRRVLERFAFSISDDHFAAYAQPQPDTEHSFLFLIRQSACTL